MTAKVKTEQEMMTLHEDLIAAEKARRVALFIDNENLFYASLHNQNSFPNYKEIMNYVTSLGHMIHAESVCDWSRLQNSLKFVVGAGIQPRFCCNAVNNDRGKQSFADCQIYVNVFDLLRTEGVEVFVLAAGSRNYIPLVHFLKASGKIVIVLAEQVSIAFDLASAADLCITLQDINALIPAPEKNGKRGT